MTDRKVVSLFVSSGESGSGAMHDPLSTGGGGGTYDGMSDRVTRLETHFEYTRKDLDEIATKLDTILDRTQNLPSKADLTTFRWQWVATAVAAIALIVGGIIGGLGWIKPDAQPAAPTIIQLPPSSPPAAANRSAHP